MKNQFINLQKVSLILMPALVSVVIINSAQAEEVTIDDALLEENIQLDNIVISAHSLDQSQDEMMQATTLLTGEALDRQRATSIGETLSAQTGIHNASYGSSVGRPVVRGMSGARVKVLQDGIDTLDASAVSPDHGINVDMHSAKKIEVLRGPATLMYGSGAFGGVVNVVDERIPTGLAEPETNLRLQYDTVNQGKAFSMSHLEAVDLSAGNELHWRLSANHFRSDEYELPKLKETLANSDMTYSNNITLGTSYVFATGYAGVAFSESKSEYGLPGHMHHEEHNDEHEEEGEEEREAARIEMRQRRIDLDGRFDHPIAGIESAKFRIGFNDYRHDEIEGGEVGTEFRRKGFEGRSEILLSTEMSQALGLQFSQDAFKAVGEEAVVPETDSATVGVFWLGNTHIDDWTVELGARLEHAQLSPEQPESINENCGNQGLTTEQYKDKDFLTHSLSLALVRDINVVNIQGWQVVGSLTSAQRAPATQELFTCGGHAAMQTFEVGNPNLLIEKALNIDVGIRKTQGRLTTALNLYQNKISDFIYAQNTGLEVEGFGLYEIVQKNAVFAGAEFDVSYQLVDGFTLTGMADRVRADDLPRIPADRVGLGFNASAMALLSTPSDWKIFGQWQQVQKQDQVAENEDPSLGYDLLSLGLSYQAVLASHEYRIDLEANNVLDEEIRQHTSFIKKQAPQAGRNLRLALNIRF